MAWMMAGAGGSGWRLHGGAKDWGQHDGGGQATAEPRVDSRFPLR